MPSALRVATSGKPDRRCGNFPGGASKPIRAVRQAPDETRAWGDVALQLICRKTRLACRATMNLLAPL